MLEKSKTKMGLEQINAKLLLSVFLFGTLLGGFSAIIYFLFVK